MRQNSFFDVEAEPGGRDAARLVLYALGEFQERGKALAGRDLPFDRLRGAFRRAAEAFGEPELDDEATAAALTALGAQRPARARPSSPNTPSASSSPSLWPKRPAASSSKRKRQTKACCRGTNAVYARAALC